MSGCYGRGEAIGHAGELLQGAVRRRGGVVPFLITLPAPIFRSSAAVRSAASWSVAPAWKTKALRTADLACRKWGVAGPLEVVIDSGIPVGRGCGSSTADCVAVARAVADWAGRCPADDEVARLAQAAEGASDATMFDLEPVAFLPRGGELLRRFRGAWPEMSVTVFDLGGPRVETLACPVPGYSNDELCEFDRLLDQAEEAFAAGDAAALGGVASRSAAIHRRRRPDPRWEELFQRAMRAGAFGVAVSHSGTVAAVIARNEISMPGGRAYKLGGVGEGERDADLVGGRRQP